MTPVSVTIITLNEAHNIGRCIDSVKDVADEVVVVDSFSSDKTVEIAQLKGAKIYQQEFLGYARQKNFAIAKAIYPLILSLDADEVLSDDLKKSILDVKKNVTADAFTFNRFTCFSGKWIRHSGWYPDTKLRLWNREKGRWQGDYVHEKVVMNKDASIKHLNGDLLHYSFNSIEEHIRQINVFSSLKAQGLFQKGKKASVFMMICSPVFKFVRHYFFNKGFLDGYYGYVISRNSAFSNYLNYAKLRELHRHKK